MIDHVDLHDAILLAIHVDWASGACVMHIRHPSLFVCTLTFTAVTHLVVPRAHPWGPSQSIHSASASEPGQFEIVMQSGDEIRIDAGEVRLVQCRAGAD